MTRTVLSALTEARTRIADIEHWTQGESAIDNTGAEVSVFSPDACAWCADGSLLASTGGESMPIYHEAKVFLTRAARRLFPEVAGFDCHFPYVAVNDGDAGIPDDDITDDDARSLAHDNILSVYDTAIKIAEAA